MKRRGRKKKRKRLLLLVWLVFLEEKKTSRTENDGDAERRLFKKRQKQVGTKNPLFFSVLSHQELAPSRLRARGLDRDLAGSAAADAALVGKVGRRHAAARVPGPGRPRVPGHLELHLALAAARRSHRVLDRLARDGRDAQRQRHLALPGPGLRVVGELVVVGAAQRPPRAADLGLHVGDRHGGVGHDQREPVLRADDDLIVELGAADVAGDRVPARLPAAVAGDVEVDVAVGALGAAVVDKAAVPLVLFFFFFVKVGWRGRWGKKETSEFFKFFLYPWIRKEKSRLKNSSYRRQRGRADALARPLVHHAHTARGAVGELRVVERDGVGDPLGPREPVGVCKVLREGAGALRVLALFVAVESGLFFVFVFV